MSIFTIEEILEVLSTRVVSGQSPQCLKKRIRRVISDSRLVRGGDLFVAFVGDRYDGHAFVPAAVVQGAVGAIVREDYVLPPQKTKRMVRPVLLGVKDTLLAYQQLATHHRLGRVGQRVGCGRVPTVLAGGMCGCAACKREPVGPTTLEAPTVSLVMLKGLGPAIVEQTHLAPAFS